MPNAAALPDDIDALKALVLAGAAMVENLLLTDACEGIDAFLDKRAPRWRS